MADTSGANTDGAGRLAALSAELRSPATSPQRLAEIAAAEPRLGAMVAGHPQAYPALVRWIAANGTPDARQAATARLQQEAARLAGPPPLPGDRGAPVPAAGMPVAGGARPAPAVMAPLGAVPPRRSGQPASQPSQPGAPMGPGMTPPGGVPSGARHRRRRQLIAILVVVALVIGLGAGVLWWSLRHAGGPGSNPSRTPEAAATGLLEDLQGKDPLSLVGRISPSEAEVISPLTEQVDSTSSGSGSDSGSSGGAAQVFAQVRKAVDSVQITTDGLSAPQAETIGGDEVSLVTYDSGRVSIEARDPDALQDALLDLGRAAAAAEGTSLADSDEDEVRDFVDGMPYSLDFAEFREKNGYPLPIVSVRDEGGWFISPMLSVAQGLFSQAQRSDSDLQRGRLVTDATRHDSPEEATKGLAEAVVTGVNTGEWSGVSAELPAAERRLYSMYLMPSIEERSTGRSDVQVTLTASEASARASGDTARVVLDDYAVSIRPDSWYSDDSVTVRVQGLAVTFEAAGETGTLDLTAPAQAADLGLDQVGLAARREDGSWHVSPLSTAAVMTRTLTDRLTDLDRQGRLEEVLAAYVQAIGRQVDREFD